MKPIEYLHPQQLGRNSLMNVSSFYFPEIQNHQSPIFENPTGGCQNVTKWLWQR